MSGLLAVGLVEKDSHGDVLWTWVYPSLSADLRQTVVHNCCLSWDSTSSIVPFVYTQSCKQWLYLRTEATDKLPKVTHVCLVLVCSDFNPHLYSCLSQMLLCRFVETSSPVTVLEVFLELLTHGQCHSVNNGTITALDFDANHWALSQSTVTDIVAMFGIEFIIVFTALLLKKRIAVYHSDISQLLTVCSSLPMFVWHRLNWNALFPLVHLDNTDELSQVTGGYIAGFSDSAVTVRSDLYDVSVNVESKEIVIATHAKDSFVMGKLHRDLATFITQCCADDEHKTSHQCVEEIAGKTRELLNNLKTIGTSDADGNVLITTEQLRQKRLPHATENFLFGLAAAEGLLQL